jgi:hypothetical protein
MTKTEIANIALAKFREGRITNIESTTDPVAVVMNDQYDHALELVLEEHRWNFAGKRVTLTQLSDDPPFGWDHQYQLPSDIIRLKDVNGEDVEASSRLFAIEGTALLTNDDEVTITYVAKVTDTNLFSPSFVEALCFKLASITCARLTGDSELAIMLDKQYNYALSKAVHNDTKAAGSRDRNLMQRLMDSAPILGGSYRYPSSGSAGGGTSSSSGTVPAHKHGLTDLLQSSATDGQTIVWNATEERWEAGDAGGASPLTTKGDIFTYDTDDTRLPVGTDGQFLKADSTQPTGLKWETASGTGDLLASNNLSELTPTAATARTNLGLGTAATSNTGDFAAASHTHAAADITSGTLAEARIPTHTGDVTGGTALTVDKTAISGKTLVTAAAGDHILVGDASDTDNLKKVTVQSITDLGGDVSDGDTLTTGLTFPNTGLHILDTGGDHDLILKTNGDQLADRTLSIELGNGDRTLTLNGNTTLSGTNTGDESTATVTVEGIAEVATAAEIDSADPTTRMVTPFYLGQSKYITHDGTETLTNKTFDANGTGNSISNIDPEDLSATGTPSASTYLRGDNTWATIAGGGDVTKVGTPVDNQVGVWTGDGTIEGTTGLTYDGSSLGVTGNITVTGTVDGVDIAARDHNEVTIAASGGRDYVTISGTQQLTLNTVDLTADVSGLLPTGNIADDAVTYAKIQNAVGNNVILGNNAGAGSVVDELTAAEVRTIINVEDGADVTDSTNVVSALDSAVLTDAGTPAATDQVLIKDAGTGVLQTADFSDFGGGDVATDTIWDAAGDLAIGTGADTAARLAIGTNGQVLTSNGTTATWAAPTGGATETAETSIWIDAGAMLPDATAEASSKTGTNGNVDVFLMANTEKVYAKWTPPPQWDGGAIDVDVYWTATGATAGHKVKWNVAAQAGGNDDAWDVAFPTPTATADDDVIASGDIHIISASSITVGGTPADGDVVFFEIERTASGATQMSQEAELLGIRVKYQNSLMQNWYSWKLGNETSDATTGIKSTWYAPAAGKIYAARGGATTATSGGATTVDVHKGGTTIFSTYKLIFETGESSIETTTNKPTLKTDPTTFAAGDKFEFEVDSTTAGAAGLHVDLLISWD